MLKTQTVRTRLFNYLSALLMVCVFALQCTPFWDYGSGTSSINGYIWLNTSNAELGSWLTRQIGSPTDVNNILGFPIMISILSIAGSILCIVKSSVSMMSVLPAACGLTGIIGYLVKPAFRLGSNWILHMVLFAVLLAVSIAQKLKDMFENDKDELKKYSKILYAHARLISGLSIENPSELGNMVCDLMLK